MRFIHRVILAVTLCLVSLSPSLLFAQSTVDTALVLAVNGSASGSLDGTANTDWWKVTVPSDGKLVVSTQAASGSDQLTIMLWMYDQNGTGEIKSYNGGWGVNTSVNFDYLLPGTYYIKAVRWTGAGTYTITSAFTPTALPVETEPNDTVEGAQTIPLNGTDTGHLGFYGNGYTDTVDWWEVTILKDGKLVVETTADASDPQLTIMLWMYDRNGAVEIKSYNGGWGNDTTVNVDNLLPGKYWIKAVKWTGYGSYTIRSTFTPSALTVESEPNDSAKVALNIPLNGSATGHLGFYRDGITDTEDWWKVTIPQDGKLMVETTTDASDPQLQIMLWMYDRDGAVEIKSYNGGWGNDTTVNVDNLLPGTYWIKAVKWTGYGSYTIRSSFTPSTLTVENESNDSTKVALDLSPNGSATGHMGFYRDGYTDTVDWWKVTVPKDGKLLISTQAAQPDSILMIMLNLYDQQGAHEIKGYNGGWGKYTTLNYDNLLPGTYYIRALHWTGFGSYTITSAFTPSTLDVESEPNDSVQVATTLDPNGTDTAHLGFYGEYYTDAVDWWKVTVPRDGKLLITTEAAQPDSILMVMLNLYDREGTREIKGYNGGWGKYTTLNYDNLKAGTYYVRAYRWTGFGSYRITSSFTPVHYANDTEPDNTRETAAGVSVNMTATGHLGYFGSDDFDSADYFSFTVPAGWDSLHVRFKPDSTLTPILHLLNSDGNEVVGGWGPTLSIANPAAGTYYFYLSNWTGYGAYAFYISKDWIDNVPVTETEELAPPTQFVVTDVPNDNGHQLQLSWTLSSSESSGDVLKYRIFRSRTGVMNDPAPLSGFNTLDALNTWELAHTVLVDSVSAGHAQYVDFVPLDNTPYYYWVQAVGADGVSKMAVWTPVETPSTVAEETPKEFHVSAPYPNPFNPTVTIGYTLPERQHVRLTVYDSLGRVVSVLENGELDAGNHETIWNGKSNRGETLGSGIYLYRIEAGIHRAQGKMTLLR